MTISPPSKVKPLNMNHSKVKILTSGIDRLILSSDVKWSDESLFEYLHELKVKAKANNKEAPGSLGIDENSKWHFNMNPSGAKGWEWILKGHDFTLTIGDWLTPISRPSIMIDIGSETLWCMGPKDAVELILSLIAHIGGEIINVKPSRVDLCLDVLMPDDLWSEKLKDYRVTRARKFHPYYDNEILTGMMIGKGNVSARLYDKIFEITTKSYKFWMFNIWNLENHPEEEKVIRIEFQLRREAIKDLGINSVNDLFGHPENVWAYCTQDWLKFQDNPGAHHTQRETFDWWIQIQNSFMGIQDAEPLIRNKAIRIDEEQIRKQTMGYLTSLAAIEMIERGIDMPVKINFREVILSIFNDVERIGKDDDDFFDEVMRKFANYNRAIVRTNQTREKRYELGFPVGSSSGKRIY
jgi:hypothetical protein